ncbi:MAG: ATPase P [Bacteroidetes bacterium]|jgi:soluble P-type ATPase|nr:ATPase P [Bacteroidota bacterium]MBT5529303.1 ATPase P [Cytophagia bacterium]MBT3422785.1 ATPase P [Bacteroidota bacterium]MBT3800033.1 ATPase P [Bacteroidota bacterium]MBT4338021.1 ATPase P [Bacteroidota bacterium]
MEIHIPGFKKLEIKNLVLDFNGTLGNDGLLNTNIIESVNILATKLNVYVLTADTYKMVREQCINLHVTLRIIAENNQDYTKMQFVKQLGSDETICIGNGRNDSLMLQEAALGIAVIEKEGGAVAAINSADLVVQGIENAIELLMKPMRLVSTLRS